MMIVLFMIHNKRSLEQLYHLFDATHHVHDVIHQLVAINGFDLQLSAALHALLLVAFLAAKAIVVAAGDDGHRVVELVTKGALNLRNYGIIYILKSLSSLLQTTHLVL
jgi:hypothetical protein